MATCQDDVDYVYDDCVDAWELSRLYGCNEAPNPVSNMSEVSVGNCIEVNQGGERFWIKVLATCTCYVIGRVMAPLEMPHPFSVGDTIRVEIYHIYNVERKRQGCKSTE